MNLMTRKLAKFRKFSAFLWNLECSEFRTSIHTLVHAVPRLLTFLLRGLTFGAIVVPSQGDRSQSHFQKILPVLQVEASLRVLFAVSFIPRLLNS